MPRPNQHNRTQRRGALRGSTYNLSSHFYPDPPKKKVGDRKGISTDSVKCGTCGAEPKAPCVVVGLLSDGVLKPPPQSTQAIGDPMTGFHQARRRIAQRERNKTL